MLLCRPCDFRKNGILLTVTVVGVYWLVRMTGKKDQEVLVLFEGGMRSNLLLNRLIFTFSTNISKPDQSGPKEQHCSRFRDWARVAACTRWAMDKFLEVFVKLAPINMLTPPGSPTAGEVKIVVAIYSYLYIWGDVFK